MTGGVAWPWQDPSWALTRVVAKMEELERGRLNLLRGPYPLAGKQGAVPPLPVETSPRVDCRGLLGYDAMMDLLSSAWCFVDLMAPNLERELALSFRQLDALAAGLPMLMGDYAPLAPLVAEYGAGWVVSFGDEEALDQALVEILADKKEVRRRGRNTRRLANDRFLCTKTIESLMEILANPSRRQGLETLTAALSRRSSEAQAQEIDLAALKLKKADLEADLGKKTLEVKTLAQQVRTLTDSLGKLAGSLEGALYLEQLQVERFQSETEEARGDQAAQRRALEAARREAAKKQRELEALIDVRDRLEADIATLRMQGGKARRRADEATAEAARLSGKLELLQEEVAARNLELASLEAERDKKQVELERAWTVRDVLVGEQARLERLVRESEVRLLEAEEGRVGYKKKVQALEAQLGEDRKQLAMQQESLERGAAEIRRLSEKLLVAEGEIARLATAGGAIGTFRGIVVSGLSRRGKKA